jgi:predicted PurR-regulated permease PerM
LISPVSIPPPTARQAKALWFSLTALAIAVFVALLGIMVWGTGLVLNKLTPVLLPLAIAGILAYLLDPVVDFFHRRGVPRARAILLVFFLLLMLGAALLATVVPQLIVETNQLINKVPDYANALRGNLGEWLEHSPLGKRAREAWETRYASSAEEWLKNALPVISAWIVAQGTRVASWFGLVVGLVLIPVYLFYFLMEKTGIAQSWTDYLPLQESSFKQEVVFVLKEINEQLIVFFRGQILVALCIGVLLTIGFFALGLNYAVLLGVMAGLLSIVPYLGVMLSIIPAVALAAIQFGDWLHPILVLALFALVQMLESLFISPKIIGDRVGLHPLTVIIAVIVGTTLMGGILGGLLAIPLTAALRTLMFRYIWRKREAIAVAARPVVIAEEDGP